MNAVLESKIAPAERAGAASACWVVHFRDNIYREWNIPWGSGVHLPATIRARIADSVAEFQRGESSEALHYLAKSERFSRQAGDAEFHAASILFVREENGHAGLLLRFMREVGIAPRKKVFSDGVFRWLRGFSDLGWSSRVLIIAELIAQEYYPCLREATAHPALRRICEKIIWDEEAHIRFQIERIARLERSCSRWTMALRDASQTILMGGAAVVVWWVHYRVLTTRMGSMGFFTAALRRNHDAMRAVRVSQRHSAA